MADSDDIQLSLVQQDLKHEDVEDKENVAMVMEPVAKGEDNENWCPNTSCRTRPQKTVFSLRIALMVIPIVVSLIGYFASRTESRELAETVHQVKDESSEVKRDVQSVNETVTRVQFQLPYLVESLGNMNSTLAQKSQQLLALNDSFADLSQKLQTLGNNVGILNLTLLFQDAKIIRTEMINIATNMTQLMQTLRQLESNLTTVQNAMYDAGNQTLQSLLAWSSQWMEQYATWPYVTTILSYTATLTNMAYTMIVDQITDQRGPTSFYNAATGMIFIPRSGVYEILVSGSGMASGMPNAAAPVLSLKFYRNGQAIPMNGDPITSFIQKVAPNGSVFEQGPFFWRIMFSAYFGAGDTIYGQFTCSGLGTSGATINSGLVFSMFYRSL
jgi:acyl carrier protein phosphodiesterase